MVHSICGRLNPLFEDFGYDYDLVVDGLDDPRLVPGLNVAARPPKPAVAVPAVSAASGGGGQLSLTDLLQSINNNGGVDGIKTNNRGPVGTVQAAGGSLTPGPNYLKVDFTDFAGYSAIPRCSYVNVSLFSFDDRKIPGFAAFSTFAHPH